VTKPDREDAGFWDAASWESVRKRGKEAIERWIDKQMEGTSVTVLLIGFETNKSEYVDYEIKSSHIKGNGMLGIYIHNMKGIDGKTDSKGINPLEQWYSTHSDRKIYYSEIYKTYDWIYDDGYKNMGDWIETAAKNAGK
jgi:hypothetical protein